MTPTEAFQLADRYRVAKAIGHEPQVLKAPPRIDGKLYLPGWFLWLCFGQHLTEMTFQKRLADETSILRKGASTHTRVYNVASVRDWWLKCNRAKALKRKNRAK